MYFLKHTLRSLLAKNSGSNLPKVQLDRLFSKSAENSSKAVAKELGTLIYTHDIKIWYFKALLGIQTGVFLFMADTARKAKEHEDTRFANDTRVLTQFNYVLAKYMPFVFGALGIVLPCGGFMFARRYVKKMFVTQGQRNLIIETYDLFKSGHVIKVKPVQALLRSDTSMVVKDYQGYFILGGNIVNKRLFDMVL